MQMKLEEAKGKKNTAKIHTGYWCLYQKDGDVREK